MTLLQKCAANGTKEQPAKKRKLILIRDPEFEIISLPWWTGGNEEKNKIKSQTITENSHLHS